MGRKEEGEGVGGGMKYANSCARRLVGLGCLTFMGEKKAGTEAWLQITLTGWLLECNVLIDLAVMHG